MNRDPSRDAYKALREFWTRFRRFVKEQLAACYGPDWEKEGLPEHIRNACRKHGEERLSRPWMAVEAEALLDFAFDEQLREIVVADKNWNSIFKQFFGRDKSIIEVSLREICWVRDEVAHWRPVTAEVVRRLKDRCKYVMDCIARAATIQADSEAAVRFLSPADLLAGKELAELVAAAQRAATSSREGAQASVDEAELPVVLEEWMLERQFEEGAFPVESVVRPTGIHERFDDWEVAPQDEVLMWQSYAPREPVSKSSKVHLAIRYNPVALKLPRAKSKHGIGWWRRQAKCFVQAPTDKMPIEIAKLHIDPKGWVHVEYKPRAKGKYEVLWGRGAGGAPRTHPWIRDEFVVK